MNNRVYLTVWSIIALINTVSCFVHFPFNARQCRSTIDQLTFALQADNGKEPEQPRKKMKSTQFDRMVDDFIGKRYGAGEGFYGKRTSSLSEEEYQEIRGGSARDALQKELEEYEIQPLADNAVLVVGDVDAAVFQWVVLDLLEKGFTVRVACEDRARAIAQFGLPGNNVDIVDLNLESSEERYARAVQGAQAIVFCVNFEPIAEVSLLGKTVAAAADSLRVADAVLDIALRAKQAKVSDVQKIVCVSRALPAGFNNGAFGGPSQMISSVIGSAKAFLSYLVRGPSLSDVNVAEERFTAFRRLHEQWEDRLRQCGLSYVIVRAPPVVESIGAGAQDEMAVLSSQQYAELSGISSSSSGSGSSSGSRGPVGAPLTIAALDMAEAVVQALLLEQIERVSFTICARSRRSWAKSASSVEDGDSDTVLPAFGSSRNSDKQQSLRAPRSSYYSILSLDDSTDWDSNMTATDTADTGDSATESKEERRQREQEVQAANEVVYADMRSSYIIRPPESFRSQLQEDVQVEKYWLALMKGIAKD